MPTTPLLGLFHRRTTLSSHPARFAPRSSTATPPRFRKGRSPRDRDAAARTTCPHEPRKTACRSASGGRALFSRFPLLAPLLSHHALFAPHAPQHALISSVVAPRCSPCSTLAAPFSLVSHRWDLFFRTTLSLHHAQHALISFVVAPRGSPCPTLSLHHRTLALHHALLSHQTPRAPRPPRPPGPHGGADPVRRRPRRRSGHTLNTRSSLHHALLAPRSLCTTATPPRFRKVHAALLAPRSPRTHARTHHTRFFRTKPL